MTDADVAILDQIRELAAELSNETSRGIVETVVDAVALNPQPLPPRASEIVRLFFEAVTLNPQPLPPEPPER